MVIHWISPPLASATDQALFSLRTPSTVLCMLSLPVFSVCLCLHVHILHSAIWKHLSFSHVMGFHSLVHEQTNSVLSLGISYSYLYS